MYLFLLFQDISGFFESLSKLSTYVLLITGIFISYIVLRTGIPDRLSSGWKKLSGMQDQELAISEREKSNNEKEIARLTLQVVDLTREVDVRREINRQDSEICKALKADIVVSEEIISRLRSEIRNINNGAMK